MAAFLNPEAHKLKIHGAKIPIFPFGCNASQYKAVKSALENQLSVIQGPPGTGKTQTILNIIANLLISEKTIEIVSNNESAVKNIYEKLSSDKYGLGFIVAMLGRADNKKLFLASQSGEYPDLSGWEYEEYRSDELYNDIKMLSDRLLEVFSMQERLSLAKLELQNIKTEQKHFEKYCHETTGKVPKYITRRNLKSKVLLRLIRECEFFVENRGQTSFWFNLKCSIFYGISSWKTYKDNILNVANMFKVLYYISRISELECEISRIESFLSSVNAVNMADDLSRRSLILLKKSVYKKYGQKRKRRIFEVNPKV